MPPPVEVEFAAFTVFADVGFAAFAVFGDVVIVLVVLDEPVLLVIELIAELVVEVVAELVAELVVELVVELVSDFSSVIITFWIAFSRSVAVDPATTAFTVNVTGAASS